MNSIAVGAILAIFILKNWGMLGVMARIEISASFSNYIKDSTLGQPDRAAVQFRQNS